MKGLFPRVFGNFREGGFIHAKFVTTGTGTGVTFALKSSQGNANYGGLSLVRSGVGLYTLTLAGGVRNLAFAGLPVILTATAGLVGGSLAPTGQAAIVFNATTTTVALQSVASAGGAAADTITAGDEVHFLLYTDK